MKAIEFAKASAEGYKAVLNGIKQKTLVYGKTTLMTEFILTKGSALPEHSHPHEQTGYLDLIYICPNIFHHIYSSLFL